MEALKLGPMVALDSFDSQGPTKIAHLVKVLARLKISASNVNLDALNVTILDV